MNRAKNFFSIVLVVLALLALSISVTWAQGPVGTIFTYQGRLTDGGVPANTSKDFEFKLYNAVVAGTQLGSTYTRNDVNVINGLFVVELDFGMSPFNGQSTYLQIGVRQWDSAGAYTTLAPRQKLTPTPYALYASAPWVTNGSNINYANGNVGIGTTSPTSKLDIVAQDGLRITGYQPFLTLRDSNASNKRGIIQSVNGDVNIFPDSFIGGPAAMVLKSISGNIGIGTGYSGPTDKLTVATATGNYGLVHTDGTASVGTFVGSGAGGGEAGWFGTKTNHPLRLFANNSGAGLTVDTTNKVGIGTLSPSAQLHVVSPAGTLPLTVKQNVAESATPGLATFETSNGVVGSLSADVGIFVVGAAAGKAMGFNVNNTTRAITIGSDGNVGIGTNIIPSVLTVKGKTTSDYPSFQVLDSGGYTTFSVYDNGTVAVGDLAAPSAANMCYVQYDANHHFFAQCDSAAEYVPTVDRGFGAPAMGDVVSIAPVANPYEDEHGPFVVAKSVKACDPNLLGYIVDPEKGASGKKLNEHYLPLAIYGYFPAKVTTENGVIKRGDPLTSSSKPGYAMKATGACRIIGYALEDANALGTIRVFANTGETAINETASLRALVQKQDAKISDMEQELAELKALVGDLQARMEK